MRRHPLLVPLAGVLLLTAACGSSSTPPATSGLSSTASSAVTSSSGGPATGTVSELKTANTALGEIVTDGNGMTLYMFTKDTQGTTMSACTGKCLAAWPLALAGSDQPKLTGVTGTVGTIPTAQGGKQLTLGGWPLYYFVKDKAAGDVLGQDVNKVWYVLDKAGTPVKSSPTSAGDASGGY